MQELKPEGDVLLWAYSGIHAKCTEPVPVTTFGQNTASTMWIIPDTHRVVPVELLHAIEIDMTMECTNFDTLKQLRSIIDKEQS
jgi:hypothetical protein